MSSTPPPPGPGAPGAPDEPQQPDPYGVDPPSLGQPNPYGPPTPYGQPPGPYQYGDAARTTDVVSITAFVLSLTFCLSLVGVVLGLVGLSRTKNEQRKGRWAAISAIVVGIVLTAIAGFLIAVVGIFAASVVTVGEAEAGICIDVDDADSDGVLLTERDCSEPHDAEIVYAGDAGPDAGVLETAGATQVCAMRIEPAIAALLQSGEFQLSALLQDPDDVAADDTLVCYVEPADGSKLSDELG